MMMPPQMKPVVQEQKSAVAQLLEARQFPFHECPLNDFKGLSEATMAKVYIRVATVLEQESAILEAKKYLEAKSRGASTDDANLKMNAETCFILHKVCKASPDPKSAPAFPSPDWMIRTLTAHEVAFLLNHYNHVAATASPFKTEISGEIIEAFAKMAADNAENDASTVALLSCEHAYISELFVGVSKRLMQARSELQALEELHDQSSDGPKPDSSLEARGYEDSQGRTEGAAEGG